jgi:uncharacterized lipoprotein YbaY
MPSHPVQPPLTVCLELPAGFDRFVASQVRVRLIDIGLADAPAPVLASVTADQVPCEPGGRLELVLQPTERAPTAHHASVQAHISRHGDRTWTKGDLVTAQSWPVAAGTTRLVVRLSMI